MSEDADQPKVATGSQPQSAEPIATPVRNTNWDAPKKDEPDVEIPDEKPNAEVATCETVTNDGEAPTDIPKPAEEDNQAAPVQSPQPDKVDPPLAAQAVARDRKAI